MTRADIPFMFVVVFIRSISFLYFPRQPYNNHVIAIVNQCVKLDRIINVSVHVYA